MSKDSYPSPKPSQLIKRNFPHQATRSQEKFFQLIDLFLSLHYEQKPTLPLKGYAGTGRTSVISSLVKTHQVLHYRSLMLAPARRAAKVMMAYGGRSGYTIPKIIYKPKGD